MEKRVVLAIALTVLLYFTWISFFAPRPQPIPPGQPRPVATGTVAASGGQTAPVAPGGRRTSDQYPAVTDEALTRVSNQRVDLTFDGKGAALMAAEAWGVLLHKPSDDPRAGGT